MSTPDVSNPSVNVEAAEAVAPIQKLLAGKNYGKAFSWGVIWLVGLTLIFSVIYQNFSAEGFGRFLAMTMIASAVSGSIASRRAVTRSFATAGGIYFLVLLAVWLITSFGTLRGS